MSCIKTLKSKGLKLTPQRNWIISAINDAKAAGHTFIQLTPEEIEPWADLAKPLHDKWIADNEALGFPAKTMYEAMLKIVK